MICKTCGAYIEDDCTFCTECGTVIPSNEVQSFEPYSEQYGEQYGEGYKVTTETQKSVTKKLALITGLTVLLVAILGIILYFCSDLHHYRKNYKTGNENFAENKYEEALKCHKEAIKYKETDEVRNAICQDYIKIAEGHLKKENFEKAIKAHQELRKYGKSTKEINSLILTDYEKWADNCLDEEDFEEAMELHREMTDYGESKNDVDERIAEDYEKWADSYLEDDKPMDALLTVYQGIDTIPHESLWEKAQEIKDRTVIAEKVTMGPDGNLMYQDVYTYDERGNLLTEENYDESENLISKKECVYTYDERGNILTEEWYDADGNLQNRKELAYDEKGNKISEIIIPNKDLNDSTYGKKYVYQYDKNNILVEEEYYKLYLHRPEYGYLAVDEEYYEDAYSNSSYLISFYQRIKFYYDVNGNRVSVKAIYDDGDVCVNKYTYDENGNMLTKEQYNEYGDLCCKMNYVYDSYGNMVEEQTEGYLDYYWMTGSFPYDLFGNYTIDDGANSYTYTYHYIENKGEI